MKSVLGISEEHDAGVAYLEDGKIIFASNEERYSRKKFQCGIPLSSLKALKNFLIKQDKKFPTHIAIASTFHVDDSLADWSHMRWYWKLIEIIVTVLRADKWIFGHKIGIMIINILGKMQSLGRKRRIVSWLKSEGFSPESVEFVDHHRCHGASAYFCGGEKEALVITQDASGDGYCSKVFYGHEGHLQELHGIPFFHSPGHYYEYVTLLFGFKRGREGKVTGLAAHGDPTKTFPLFHQLLSYDSARKSYINKGLYRAPAIRSLKKMLQNFSQEDIAAGIQKHLETVMTSYIEDMLLHYAPHRPIPLAVAGGVFANVRLNQKVAELDSVKSFFVFPHMADGGLAVGAALSLYTSEILPQKLGQLYVGDDSSENEVTAAIADYQDLIISQKPVDLPAVVAGLLAQGKVVAVVRGRMEYGPRALGNRSILYQATDATVNDWLNKRLKRTEYMPFAPILREENLATYFTDWEKCVPNLPYMTITVNCNEKCRAEAPAITHVDGTARPQLVSAKSHPFVYEILKNYEYITQKKILINTSYNIHEEPIVRTAQEAIQTFLTGKIDVLVLEDYIIVPHDSKCLNVATFKDLNSVESSIQK